MHGLDEIREMNENPTARRKDQAMFAGLYGGCKDDCEPEPEPEPKARKVDSLDLLFADLLFSGRADFTPLERRALDHLFDIDSDPFTKFWAKLNAERERDGKPEALYKEADEAFMGGPTPKGALTFVGKKWDGLRAVPAEKAYYGEFREVVRTGETVWWRVHDKFGARSYAAVEDALEAALEAKHHSKASRRG